MVEKWSTDVPTYVYVLIIYFVARTLCANHCPHPNRALYILRWPARPRTRPVSLVTNDVNLFYPVHVSLSSS